MPIRVICPFCAKRLRAPSDLAGQETRCSGCQNVIVIPGPAEANPKRPHLLFLVLGFTIPPLITLGGAYLAWGRKAPVAIAAPQQHHLDWQREDEERAAKWRALAEQQAAVAKEMARLEEAHQRLRDLNAGWEEHHRKEQELRNAIRQQEEIARQADQQQAEEDQRRVQEVTRRATLLDRSQQASAKLTALITDTVAHGQTGGSITADSALLARQRALVLDRANSMVRKAHELLIKNKLDSEQATDLLTNDKHPWNATGYRKAIHEQAEEIITNYGDVIPAGSEGTSLVTLRDAWNQLTKYGAP
jgi:hypothetical protein